MKTIQSSTPRLGLVLACGLLTFAATKPPKPPPAPTGPTYKIVSLGTLGGNSLAYAINKSGWIAGAANGGAFVVVPEASANGPVYFRDTSPADGRNDLMRLLPGIDPAISAAAVGLNDAGLIVGLSFDIDSYVSTLWLNGAPINLADATADGSSAVDINNHGLIATSGGWGNTYVIVPEDTDLDGVADTWVRDANGDGINDLRKLVAPLYFMNDDPNWPIEFEPMAINNAGQIVVFGNGGNRYYLLTPDYTDADGDGNPWYADVNADGFNDLLWRVQSADEANDINLAGQVVGRSGTRAVRWDFNGTTQTVTDLGVLGGNPNYMRGTAINDAGQVVGWGSFRNGSCAAFVVYKGTMYNLAERLTSGAGWANLKAEDVNNQGYIVGHGQFGGVTQAFVAVPVTQP